MMRSLRAAGVAWVAIAAALGGCAVGPDYETPTIAAPKQFEAASGDAQKSALDIGQWWRSLGDAKLDSLVERAVANNPDVEIALTRLQEARTQEAVLLGYALPEGGATGALGNGTGSDVTRGRVPSLMTSASNTADSPTRQIKQIAGFDAFWELDLFGQYRRAIEAGIYDAQSAAEARNAVLVGVISDLVRAYVDLRGLQLRLVVLQQDIDLSTKSRDFVKIRFERGLTNELDLSLAERELSTLKSEQSPLAAQRDAARFTIATLLGVYPEDIKDELNDVQPIVNLPARIEPGLPLDLIKRRPDVRQSERQLAAATARIGVAVGELFPHVGLAGSIGTQFAHVGSGSDSGTHIWSLGPSAYWSVLDFGALDAQVDIADLRSHEQLVGYKRSVLNAVREVDSSIEAFDAQQDSVGNLSDALAQAQRGTSLANERYERGLTDFLNVVDAQRQLYNLESQVIVAQQSAGEDLVAVYRSLGGGWQTYQKTPDIRIPHPALVAMFERLVTPQHEDLLK
jgi:NodT family efflux transporter outer membrane factor (OMF) lipoprotein